MQPVVGRKLWFGPRRWGGWGWTPVSWEGWAVVVGALVAVLVAIPLGPVATTVCAIVVIPAVIAACVAKGTPPGGPRAWRRFQDERRNPS